MENLNIPFIDLCNSVESSYEESVDAIVSDLYPDISEVIGITAKAYIKDVAIQNDRILITGEVKCEVCFQGENSNSEENNILKMNVNLSFARVEEIDALDCVVFTKCSVQTVNARIINPRKISVIADICLKTDVYKQSELEINKTENLPYELKKMTKNIEVIDTVNRNDFTLSDNVIFPISAKADYEIFGMSPNIVLTDVKILKNKLMLRGNIEFNGGYIEEDNVRAMSANVPFSQICDVNIIDENLRYDLETTISEFEIEHKDENEYYFNIKVKCLFLQFQKYEIECIEDVYSTTNELVIVKDSVSITNFAPTEITHNSHNIEIDANSDNILLANCNMYKTKNDQGQYEINASIMAIYQYNNICRLYQKQICVFKNAMNCDIANEKLEVSNQLKLSYDLLIDNSSTITYDKYLEIEESNPKDIERDCIILKHINSNVNVWDIAKEYNSTEDAIKLANDIEIDNIHDKMIIIPR